MLMFILIVLLMKVNAVWQKIKGIGKRHTSICINMSSRVTILLLYIKGYQGRQRDSTKLKI